MNTEANGGRLGAYTPESMSGKYIVGGADFAHKPDLTACTEITKRDEGQDERRASNDGN